MQNPVDKWILKVAQAIMGKNRSTEYLYGYALGYTLGFWILLIVITLLRLLKW